MSEKGFITILSSSRRENVSAEVSNPFGFYKKLAEQDWTQ